MWLACGCVQSTLGESATELGHDDAQIVPAGADAAANPPDATLDSDARVEDATVANDASRDTGADVIVYDAGCNGSDDDQDGICAAGDNCPDISNPSQDDADDDGKGDACDACVVDPIPALAELGGGSVMGISINGGSSSYAEVTSGEQLEVRLNYVFQCVPGVPVALQVGFEMDSNSACSVSTLCVPQLSGMATSSFTAPTTPGVYYIRARMPEAVTCVPGAVTPWVTGLPTDARVAAICVQ